MVLTLILTRTEQSALLLQRKIAWCCWGQQTLFLLKSIQEIHGKMQSSCLLNSERFQLPL